MSTVLTSIWAAIGDQVIAALVSLISILLAVALYRVQAWAKAKYDAETYASLYRTIEYVLKALLATRGTGSLAATAASPLIHEAIDMVRQLNPKAVAAAKQDDEALKTKVIAKLPEAQATVAEAVAKARAAL